MSEIKNIKIETCDGKIITVPLNIMDMSVTISNMLDGIYSVAFFVFCFSKI
jgi:hypothetical protein